MRRMLTELKSKYGKIAATCGVVFLSANGFFFAVRAVAVAQSTPGTIWGKLIECGPGATLPHQKVASPAMVILISRGHTYSSEFITFSKSLPWTGSFSFAVRPGDYEVISSMGGVVKFVTVESNSRHLVSFGLPICAT